ncbi:cation-translocating P-type ATPase [Trichlorobacter lovleyi]|uniref:ATPase, P-type (Transporting), HAD superfamily, subfamily IC n=1 Tax=Trichlorobacter lovleyi (strain ATCC BAA-1151 / DSM 17278 / SZ) TaxID=398767 RepID=B3E6D9_TRIL1|nr:cation-translocating P-type ATPase [Trichlorobacter lovleyi]ACD96286.1 ATPase, P-type (transporting), HAD superfamily, subfamily IC [Trichlorobacter lovleyi SZ]
MNRKPETVWHALGVDHALEMLQSAAESGLTADQAARRLQQYGQNELTEQAGRTPWQILWEQFTSTMALILSAAAVVSGLVGSFKDAATIFAIVILFALLGFAQDFRAERAIAALKRMAVPLVRVRRDGVVQELPSLQLVPGDIVLLEAGSVVPADCRLLEAHGLRVQEALLTGESEAVEKHTDLIASGELPLGDRRNLLFMGTLVSAGRAVALVVATGMQTELGSIATMLQQVGQEWTPLQKRLDRLGKVLAVVSVVVAGLIFGVGMLRGEALKEMLLLAVSVAVAAIPEGLPAVVTITLALGAQRMLKRHALIRRLPAVETLGSVTVICSDKTGTLTQNRMAVTGLMNTDSIVGGAEDAASDRLLLMIGALCNDAVLKVADGEESVLGDPTEGALVSAAATAGLYRSELEQALPRIAEIPFDSTTKRMITVHQITALAPGLLPLPPLPPGGKLLAAKGALDSVLALCSAIVLNSKIVALTDDHTKALLAAADRLSNQGQRVLALALRVLQPDDDDRLESLAQEFICIGLAALTDPPRQEAQAAVQRCLTAGIRPVMITGDHPLTARAIARQVGIDDAGGALTGVELDRLNPEQFDEAVSRVSVYARVAPEHKLRIVDAIQRSGGVAAMTGDGVNDAPALKKADVGVAMGKVGTDVAREASDMVLLDDNFATIVAAVEEGRTIYDNIRKFVVFSVAGNTGKILAVLILPFLGLGMPLTPLQLLWLNLLTDGLLGLGMGLERAEPDVMKRPPIAPDSQIFDRRTIRYVVLTGSLIGGSCMLVTWFTWQSGGPWQTVLFASLALAQIAQAMGLRSFRSSFLQMGLFSNLPLLAMAASVLLLQGLAIWLPQLQGFFRTTALTWEQLGLVLLPAVAVFLLLEGEKWAGRLGRTWRGN